MLNQLRFICSPKHYKIILFFSCFNDLNKYTAPYMKIACFGWGKFTKTWIFQLAPVSCNVIMDFHYPDILMNKFMYEDKCCTSGLGCSLNRALFGCQLPD